MPSNGPVALRLDHVSKRYFLNPTRPWRIQDLALRPRALLAQLRQREPFWAVRDVSLEVKRGEVLGIIGANGSGKSSLLRMLVGISPPTSGSVSIHGRYAALLELGAGFHPQATGRENAYLNALFMGLPRSRAKQLIPHIIAFAGLEAFADQPMRTYSSGMYLRLGFSVAIHVQPEILVIDEILAVGDADFQQKCLDHFARLKEEGTTVVLVTHNLASLRDYTDRVILLEHGTIALEGNPDDVADAYLQKTLHASPAARRTFRRALREHGFAIPEDAEQDDPLTATTTTHD